MSDAKVAIISIFEIRRPEVEPASTRPGHVKPPPLHHAGPEVHVEDIDVLEVSPAMEDFLQRYVLKYDSPQTRLEMLITAVSRFGILGFEYDETRTKTSAEAFNCMYDRLNEFREVKAKIDPHNRFQSSQARRLRIVDPK